MPTEQQTETRREVAERVVRETILVVPGKIADRYIAAIEAALKDRDERAARIADAKATEWGDLADRYWNDGDCSNARIRQGWAAGAQTIARAIRNEG